MSKIAISAITFYGLIAWFGMHGAACAMHMVAAERYWSRGGNPETYKWSHAYCKAMSFPLRALTGSLKNG